MKKDEMKLMVEIINKATQHTFDGMKLSKYRKLSEKIQYKMLEKGWVNKITIK